MMAATLSNNMTTSQTISAQSAPGQAVAPCSPRYYKGISRAVSIKSRTQKRSSQSKLRKLRARIAKAAKRVFGVKAKATFVMSNEYGNLLRGSSRLSKRSRLFKLRMTVTTETNRNSAPAVLVTMPTQKGSNVRLSAHNYSGADSPVDKQSLKQFRWSHPTVQEVVPPRTPMSATSVPCLIQSERDIQDWETISSISSHYSGPARADSDTPLFSMADVRSDDAVHPRNIFMRSSQSVTADGKVWNGFRDGLDGHQTRSDKQCPRSDPRPVQHVPKNHGRRSGLPYLAKASPLNPDAISSPSQSDINEALRVHNARKEALRKLEGPRAEAPQEFVKAWVPKEALEHPISLVPGSSRNLRRVENRHTWSGPAADARKYRAYIPAAAPPLMPKIPENMSKGKRAADTGVRNALDDVRSAGPSTVNQHHGQQYQRVESGMFNETPVLHPVSLTPSASFPYVNSTPLTLLPATRSTLSRPAPKVLQSNVQRDPVQPKPDTMKALPATPAAKSLRHLTSFEATSKESLAPAPLMMTDNGYPNFLRDSSRNYSAEPKYERRSVNEVEAKYRRQQAAKTEQRAKSDKKTAKQEKQAARAEKKIAEMKAKVAKMEQAQQVNESLKKLIM